MTRRVEPAELAWHSHGGGSFYAVGLRGTYAIEPQRNVWLLSGAGHDDLPMLALPAQGKPFLSLDAAQSHANRVDRVHAVEPQVSGA